LNFKTPSQKTTRIFLEAFNESFSYQSRYDAINLIASELHRCRLLTDEELEEVKEVSKQSLKGKTLMQVAKKSKAVGKVMFRLSGGFIEFDMERATLQCYSPLEVFKRTFFQFTNDYAERVLCIIIEHMRHSKALTEKKQWKPSKPCIKEQKRERATKYRLCEECLT